MLNISMKKIILLLICGANSFWNIGQQSNFKKWQQPEQLY